MFICVLVSIVLTDMETATKNFFRALGSIYDGMISSSSFYPALYFTENKKTNIYYGFRVAGIMPTRLVARFYEQNNDIIIDTLWLIDNSNLSGEGCVYYNFKKSHLNIDGEPQTLLSKIRSDATIQASFPDILALPEVLEGAVIGSSLCYNPSKIHSYDINIVNVPGNIIVFTRSKLSIKKLQDIRFQEKTVDALISLVDLVQRTLEIYVNHKSYKSSEMVFCVRCGQSLKSDSFYCPYCGGKQ